MKFASVAPAHLTSGLALVSTAPRITPREKQVLLLMCDGLTGKEVARALGISPKTVEFHRARLARAIGSRSLAHLVRFAVRTGLIEP